MNTNRLINGLIGVAILAVLGLGWVLGVSPTYAQVQAAQDQTTYMTTTNNTTATKLISLKKQFEDIDALEADLDELRASIPYEASIPDFLTEIRELSAQYGVTLTTLTVSGATLYAAPAAPGTPATPPADGATTDPATPADPAAAVPATPATANLVILPVVVVVSGSFSQVMAFTGAIQTGSRLFLVTQLSVTNSVESGLNTGTLTGAVFVLPLPAGVKPPTSTATPTPTPTATSSATPDPTSTAPVTP